MFQTPIILFEANYKNELKENSLLFPYNSNFSYQQVTFSFIYRISLYK